MFPPSAIAQLQTLFLASMEDEAVLSDAAGVVYNGPASVVEDEMLIRRLTGGDASFDGKVLVQLPPLTHDGWARRTFDQSTASVDAAFQGLRQTGRVTGVSRDDVAVFLAASWTDQAEDTGDDTATDLTAPTALDVIPNGPGSVALVYEPGAGATSHQAQVDGANSGAAVGGAVGIIVLTGLTPGVHTFRVVASDGRTTVASGSVSAEVPA